jgi:hypothetical protein
MTKTISTEFIRRIPKINLHVHLWRLDAAFDTDRVGEETSGETAGVPSRNIQMPELAGLEGGDSGLQQCRCGLNAPKIIAREFQNGDPTASEVLLIADVLIGGDEQLKVGFGEPE